MRPMLLPCLLGLLYGQAASAWVTSHSGNDTVRVIAHAGDVVIDGDFAKTTISLTFANRGQQKEGGIYQFMTDYGAAPTNLELKIGKNWQKGVLLERAQASEAYSAITGLDTTPRSIDPGLLVKEAAGSFTLYVYPVSPGGTLEVRFTLLQRVTFDGVGFAYSYPDLGDETMARPKLNLTINPPAGRAIASATFGEQEVKLAATKTGALLVQPKLSDEYSGMTTLYWTLKPPSAPVPLPTIEMTTAPGTKGDSFLYLRISLDPTTPAQEEMNEYPSYNLLAITYDTPLPEGGACSGNIPTYLDPGVSYTLLCWLQGSAPKSAQAYITKNGFVLDRAISASAKTLDSTTLAAAFLTDLDDGMSEWGYLALLSAQERDDYSSIDPDQKARARFFALADRYNVVTTMTSLLAIDPDDEFSRDVVAFAKKWGARYASQMLGDPFQGSGSIGIGSGAGTVGMGVGSGVASAPKAAKGTVTITQPKPEPVPTKEPRFYNPFSDELGGSAPKDKSIELTEASPTRVLQGQASDRDSVLSAIKLSPAWGQCLKDKSLAKDAALLLAVQNGAVVEVAFYNFSDSGACSTALRAITFPKVTVEFVALLSATK